MDYNIRFLQIHLKLGYVHILSWFLTACKAVMLLIYVFSLDFAGKEKKAKIYRIYILSALLQSKDAIFCWCFLKLIYINWWIYWCDTCSSSLIFIYLSLASFYITINEGTEGWVDAICYGLLFAKSGTKRRKVKSKQGSSSGQVDSWNETRKQSCVTYPNSMLWSKAAVRPGSICSPDHEEGLAGSCWKLELVFPVGSSLLGRAALLAEQEGYLPLG